MLTLITNDDGIYAPGLWLLVEALQPLGEVVVVAPDREQSGVSSSISLHSPLHVNKVQADVPAYAVQGTPADAVILALGHILYKRKVDLIISGINAGSNVGSDILYSGTVGAALQGHFQGIPSMALSVTSVREPKFEVAASLARALAEVMCTQRIFRQALLNGNVPSLPREEIEGGEITRLARRRLAYRIRKGTDGRRDFVWITRERRAPNRQVEEGTDVWAIRNKRVSLCPIWYDMTEASAAPRLVGARRAVGKALGLVRGARPKKAEEAEGSEAKPEAAPPAPARKPNSKKGKKNEDSPSSVQERPSTGSG